MSTVRLLKDHGSHKAKTLISVPFGKGREMIAQGVAELAQGQPAAAPAAAVGPTVAQRHADEIARLNALHAAALQAVRDEAAEAGAKWQKEYDAEIAKLEAELQAARDTIAGLNAKKK